MLSATRARTLTSEIKSQLANLEDKLSLFHSERGWVAMGYSTFLEWWDAELGDIPITSATRKWAVIKMAEEAMYYDGGSGRMLNGTIPAMAEAVGYAPATVAGILLRTRKRAEGRITGMTDDETVHIGVGVPNVWRKNLINAAREHDCSMADLLRPIIARGVKEAYGVDLDKPTRPATKRKVKV